MWKMVRQREKEVTRMGEGLSEDRGSRMCYVYVTDTTNSYLSVFEVF